MKLPVSSVDIKISREMVLCRKRRILKRKLAGIGFVFLMIVVLAQYQEFSYLHCCSKQQKNSDWHSTSPSVIRTVNLTEIFADVKPNNKNNISVFKEESSKILIQTASRAETYIGERLQKHHEACVGKEFIIGREPDRSISSHFQVSKSHQLIYCSIEKAGTTFWRRVLQMLDSTNLDSPYQIKPLNVNKHSQSLVKEDFFRMLAKLRTHALFMFVRNPFSRLLSGYLDKIYTANPYYWGMIGKEIRSSEMNNAIVRLDQMKTLRRTERPQMPCYNDITFDEFIQYVIDAENTTSHKRDPHFMSMYDLCKPCQINYDFIGKMETFKKDFNFIMGALNISKFDVNDLEKRASDDIFLDVASSLDERRNEIVKCMSMHEAYLRSWKHMQIRGLISNQQNYPYSEKQSQYLHPVQLVRTLKAARSKSTSRKELQRQKEQYFIDIYRTVQLEKLERLVKVLKNDFEIFDYEKYPETVFVKNIRERLKHSAIFDVLR